MDDEARLIARQDDLEKKLYNVQLKGLSLLETLDVLLINFEKDAEALKKDFGISDKRFWWVKIQAYAKKNAWPQLLEFGKKPTSPIGYEVRQSKFFKRYETHLLIDSHLWMYAFELKNSMKLAGLQIDQSILRNSMMNVFHLSMRKFSK